MAVWNANFPPQKSKVDFLNTPNIHIRVGQKGVNFGNSLTAVGVSYMGSKDKDVVKYF